MSKVTWGIDIGESVVRAVKMRVTKTKAEVIAIDSIPRTFRADGFNYVDKDEQVRAALTTLVRRNRMGNARVALSVPGAGFDRFISLPAVSLKQVPQIVKYEAKQQIPFPLEEVAWDYQAACERPVPGEPIEIALFAIKNQIIQQMLASLSAAGLGVDIIGMSRLALYNVLKWDRQIGSGTMIIDIGPGSTDIIILADGNFRVRSIPISSDSVTKVLQQKFSISQEEADDLKKKTMQSKQPDKMFGVMRPTFDRLLGEIHKTIGYYKQQFKTLKIEQAFLVGESFRIQPLVDLFRESLGCQVSVLSDFQRISLAGAAASSEYGKDLPSFGVAMGLALQAAGEGPITINVLPHELKVQREVARKKPYMVAAVACLGIALAAVFYGARVDSTELQAVAQKKDNKENKDSPESKIKEYDDLAKRYKEAEDVAKIEGDIKGLAGIGQNRDIMLLGVNELAKAYDAVSNEIFLTKVVMTEAVNRPDGEDESAPTPPTPPAEGAEGVEGQAPVAAKPEPVYEMLIDGWTERDLKYVDTNLLTALKKEKDGRDRLLFTKNGKAIDKEIPAIIQAKEVLQGIAATTVTGDKAETTVRKRIEFTIRVYVTVPVPLSETAEPQGDAK